MSWVLGVVQHFRRETGVCPVTHAAVEVGGGFGLEMLSNSIGSESELMKVVGLVKVLQLIVYRGPHILYLI